MMTSSKDLADLHYFTGEQLKDGLMVQSFKRFLHKEMQRHVKLARNEVTDHQAYDFCHEIRGIAIVISNEVFNPDSGSRMEPRAYAKVELRKMNEMFSGLGFIVMLFKDLTAAQMYDVIKTVTSQDMDFFLGKSDAFACVLASHGNEIQEDNPADPNIKNYHHIIYGTDRPIRTHLLLDLVHDRRCEKLQGKPKMFFIQACRSRFRNDPGRFDAGVNVTVSNKRHVTQLGLDKNESISMDSTSTSEDKESNINSIMTETPCKDKLENGSNESERLESPSNIDPFSSGDRIPPQEIVEKVENKNCTSQISGERSSKSSPEYKEDSDELSHKLSLQELIPCLEVEIIMEETKDISEDPSIIQRGIDWVRKRIFKKMDRVARNEAEEVGDTVTTVATPCHNDFLIMYSTSQGKAGFGRDEKGGWMIHEMHRIMEKYIEFIGQDRRNCLDFLSVMTCVMRVIGFYYETDTGNPNTSGLKTAPTMQHKLSKDLIFRNKYGIYKLDSVVINLLTSINNMSSKDVDEFDYFTGEELEDGQMVQFFKRFLKKELQRRAELTRNGVTDHHEYDFSHEVRGVAIVIVNEIFKPGSCLEPRKYAKVELRKMNEMFSGLGFIVMLFKDLKAEQMRDVIETVTSKDMDFFLDKSDAFACVLASHGNEIQEENPIDPKIKNYHHNIYGIDGPIRTHLLLDLVHDRRCKKLQGKPKMFFIQACRSRFNDTTSYDYGVKVPTYDKLDIRQLGNKSILADSVPLPEDSESTVNPTMIKKIAQSGDESECSRSFTVIDPFSSGDRTSQKEIVEKEETKDCISQISRECSKPTPESEENRDIDLPALSNKPGLQGLHEGIQDISEDPSVIQRCFNWIGKRVFKMIDRIVRNEDAGDTMTTVATPCHNDFLVMYSTSQGKVGFGRDDSGGWMIHVMHGIMSERVECIRQDKIDCLNFLSTMTRVMGFIGSNFETKTRDPNTTGLKTALTLQHKLTKDTIFRKKYLL
ncbi:uncharacterized protein LOC133184508 [Saccostrea echinata]|uniref:uncharacterized protein LOC133184508 n=1 Tax=Saccostrea echinata TaxID=191078 RepID=UPI002A8116DF|nr:uncharacterized protein LOC133184508 [Saccostrea echinata]